MCLLSEVSLYVASYVVAMVDILYWHSVSLTPKLIVVALIPGIGGGKGLGLRLVYIKCQEQVSRSCRFVLLSLLQAVVLYGEAVSRDLFPSLWQRSLINEPGLRAMPWWEIGETGYKEELMRIVNALENITKYVCAYVYQERCCAFVYM